MAITELLQFAAALVLVLALIGLSTVAARRLGLGHAGRRSAPRRLAIVEVLPVDARRRLVLVRCDKREHLLLLGPGGDQVVNAGPHPAPLHRPLDRGSPGQDGAAP